MFNAVGEILRSLGTIVNCHKILLSISVCAFLSSSLLRFLHCLNRFSSIGKNGPILIRINNYKSEPPWLIGGCLLRGFPT